MKIVTTSQMREADAHTIASQGVNGLELMKRAGAALADEAENMLDLRGKRIRERVLVVCGGGNNGGDGFVCARILTKRGQEADVVFFAEKTSAECAEAKNRFLQLGGKILTQMPKNGYSLVVDCLLGTGFHGELSEPMKKAIAGINALKAQGAKVLAADIPSGVDGDNGCVREIAVQADKTLCLGEVKAGVYFGDGIDYAGEVLRADIGIVFPNGNYATLLNSGYVAGLLPHRKRNTNKGDYGKAAIVAGCKEYTGAAYLAMAACLRAGAGYTTLFTPAKLLPQYMLKAPEALLVPLCKGTKMHFEDAELDRLLGYSSIAYGMGMGVSKDVAKGAEYLIENYTGKLVLDADALNSLAVYCAKEIDNVFAKKKCDVVITPHVKEFSRFTSQKTSAILENGLYAATGFAKKHGVSVLLKNAVTTITDGEKIFLNTAGGAGQAKGGSGDVLSGVIASLCACGFSGLDAACAGAYLTGKAAELAMEKYGEYSLTARDTIEYLGEAFTNIQKCE